MEYERGIQKDKFELAVTAANNDYVQTHRAQFSSQMGHKGEVTSHLSASGNNPKPDKGETHFEKKSHSKLRIKQCQQKKENSICCCVHVFAIGHKVCSCHFPLCLWPQTFGSWPFNTFNLQFHALMCRHYQARAHHHHHTKIHHCCSGTMPH